MLAKDLKDFDVHAILGNHDYEMVSQQDFTNPNEDSATLLSAESWGDKVLYETEARKLYKKYGYCSQSLQVRDKIYEKIKIIYLNSQACYGVNN